LDRDRLPASKRYAQPLQAGFKRAITRVEWLIDVPQVERQNAEAHRVAADKKHNSER